MGLDKARVKIGTIKGIGNQIDDIKEGVEKSILEFEGSVQALKSAVPKIEALFEHVDIDIDEGKVPEEGVLAAAGYAKQYIRRAANIVDNLRVSASAEGLRAEGKLQGLDDSIKIAKKEMETELRKVAAFAAALEAGTVSIEDGGDIPERAVGTHPGNPIADRKAADEAPEEAEEEDSEGSDLDLDSMDRDDLLALASEYDLKIDKRWSLTRLRRTVEDALNAEDT